MAKTTDFRNKDAPHDGFRSGKTAVLIDELYNYLQVPIFSCDAKGHIISFNNEAERLWGTKPEPGERWPARTGIFRPDGQPISLEDSPIVRSLRNKTAAEGEEILLQRPDNSLANVLVYSGLLFDESGELRGALNTLVDVTEQRKGEAKHAMLAAIVESSEDAIASKTLQGLVTSWNRAAEKMFGYKEHEMIGKSITVLIPPERMNEENMILENIGNNVRVEHYETYRLTKEGRQIPVSLTISPIRNSEGRIIGASKIARNIQKQKEAEARILRYTESLEILYSVSKMVSASLSAEAIVRRVTNATTRLTGADFGVFIYNWPREDAENHILSDFKCEKAGCEVSIHNGILPDGPEFHHMFTEKQAFRVSNRQTDDRWQGRSPFQAILNEHSPVASYLAVPVISKTGGLIGGLLYGHSEQQHFTREHENLVAGVAAQATIALDNAQLYEQVSELNSKKDEFIGLASHELKTPVTSLKAYLQIIERELPGGQTTYKAFVQKALLQTNKLLGLISDLLDISKIEAGKLPLSFNQFDLQELATDVIELMQYSFPSCKIMLTCKALPVMVRADRQRIEQVIINLLSNALKYSPDEGRVEICVSRSNENARVSVRDFGIGISKTQQQHIFSRFYRVDIKDSPVSGLGIGLYLSKEIIERHNGTLQVESELGKGSVFYFEIPLEGPEENLRE